MGGGIAVYLSAVVSRTDDLSLMDYNCPDRHFAHLGCRRGFRERQVHEVLVLSWNHIVHSKIIP